MRGEEKGQKRNKKGKGTETEGEVDKKRKGIEKDYRRKSTTQRWWEGRIGKGEEQKKKKKQKRERDGISQK